jgi:hypothetical protein
MYASPTCQHHFNMPTSLGRCAIHCLLFGWHTLQTHIIWLAYIINPYCLIGIPYEPILIAYWPDGIHYAPLMFDCIHFRPMWVAYWLDGIPYEPLLFAYWLVCIHYEPTTLKGCELRRALQR